MQIENKPSKRKSESGIYNHSNKKAYNPSLTFYIDRESTYKNLYIIDFTIRIRTNTKIFI